MNRALVLVLLVLLALPMFAADSLGKFKDWEASPQAYFLTKGERAQWATIHTEEAAQQFVDQYMSSRGPGFAEDLAKRIANADKYLTVGKAPGSQTLRGKIVVLLGPPSSFRVANREVEGPRTSGAGMAAGVGAGGDRGGQGASVADMAQAAERQGMGTKSMREYTIAYEPKKLPPAFDRDLTVIVDADQVSGKDRLADPKQMKDLETLFEMVAAGSIKK
jgi:GWxTD domain-containing protein